MTPIPLRFAIPQGPDDFQQLCLALLKLHWSRPQLQIFGKSGEEQNGVDIIDLCGEPTLLAAQCKLKEQTKSLPPQEIQDEVDKAKQFKPPIGKYTILTTAKVSTRSQAKVREINQAHRASGLFEVEVLNWDHICTLLQQYPEVQEQFFGEFGSGRGKLIEETVLTIKDGIGLLRADVSSLTSKSGGDSIDADINEAREYIKKRECQLATLLLNRVRHNKAHSLSQYQKFRVLSNLGAATLGLGEIATAAKYFLEALSYQPDDEQGRINEVLAYYLIGDLKASHEKAETLRQKYPASSRLAALWLTTAPREKSLRILEPEISSVLKNDAEVCVALARRAMLALSFDKAQEYAKSAIRLAPKWSQPQLVLASVYLGKAMGSQFGLEGRGEAHQLLLQEAMAACSEGLDLAQEEKDSDAERSGLVLRVDLWVLLRNPEAATRDAEHANKLAPGDPQTLVAMSTARLASGQIDESISILKKAHALNPRPDVSFAYARYLCRRGRDDDVKEALSVFRRVPVREVFPAELRPTLVIQATECFAKTQNWAEAEIYLDGLVESVDAVVLRAAKAYLAYQRGDAQAGERLAAEAQVLLAESKNISADTREFLARLWMLMGRPAQALPIWQELFDQQVPSVDPRNLLNCAARLKRDGVVIRACQELRSRGVSDWSLLEFELQFLERYNINAAIDRLEGFLVDNPNHALAKLRLSMIGLSINKAELVSGQPEELPSVDHLPLDYVIPAVHVLRRGGNPIAAVDYAYRFLRLHFGDLEAHQALIVSMTPGAHSPDIPAALEAVAVNTAVCYQELPDGAATWAVLENTRKPSAEFEETSPNSPVAVKLIGKKVGDEIVLIQGAIQNRTVKVLQVLSKYVRRYQDSMSEMQVRFGADSTVESIKIETTEGQTESPAISLIRASVEKRAATAAKVYDLYAKESLSLHWYGTMFGGNAYVSLENTASEQGHVVKCCSGDPTERVQALNALQTAKTVIVDLTSLATLRLLRLEKVLSSKHFRFVVSERAWITLQEMLANAKELSVPHGTLHLEQGRLQLYEPTAEQTREQNRRDEEFIRLVESSVKIEPSLQLAELDPEKRDLFTKFFGPYGAESMVLAAQPDSVLWTDDLIHAVMAAKEFGCRRVWTQVALEFLMGAGQIEPDEYHEASANLVGMEFATTLFDSSTMIAGCKLSGWSLSERPASLFVKTFAEPTTDIQRILGIYIEFIVRLFREMLLPDTRCEIARAFLDALDGRPGVLDILVKIRKQSSQIFGLNEIGRRQFDACFDRWFKNRGGPIIQPGA